MLVIQECLVVPEVLFVKPVHSGCDRELEFVRINMFVVTVPRRMCVGAGCQPLGYQRQPPAVGVVVLKRILSQYQMAGPIMKYDWATGIVVKSMVVDELRRKLGSQLLMS